MESDVVQPKVSRDSKVDRQKVSILIPSRNRRSLLKLALESVANQTHQDIEIIVIDDASSTPLNRADLIQQANQEVTLLVNSDCLGQAVSREKGEQQATGDYILHLDDDDLLHPEALAMGLSVFRASDEIEIVYFNVKGFGPNATYFETSQNTALKNLLDRPHVSHRDNDVLYFDSPIFPMLLDSVPMAFQRPLARRDTWKNATALRRKAYGSGHPLPPPLRESEWSIYASACTTRIALITKPYYLQRCEGQEYFSIAEGVEAAEASAIEIAKKLNVMAASELCFKQWGSNIRLAYANVHFGIAYRRFFAGERLRPFRHLFTAFWIRPRGVYLKFGLRMLFPR